MGTGKREIQWLWALKKAFWGHMPVSRSRYERELKLQRDAMSRSVEQEKEQLRSVIQRLIFISSSSVGNNSRELRVGMRVSDDLLYYCRNPYERERFFFHIAEEIARNLEKELR